MAMRIRAATILPTLSAIIALIIAGLFAVNGNAQASPAHYRVVGYATGWSPLQDKDAGKIDTLIFAFAQLQQGRVTLDAARAQRLRQLIALKATHPRPRQPVAAPSRTAPRNWWPSTAPMVSMWIGSIRGITNRASIPARRTAPISPCCCRRSAPASIAPVPRTGAPAQTATR